LTALSNTADGPNITNTTKGNELAYIKGGAAIKKYALLNDKRHIITRDTDQNVAIYDVLKIVKVEDLGQIDFDEEIKKRNKMVYIPNWFTVDLKTGVCRKILNIFLN